MRIIRHKQICDTDNRSLFLHRLEQYLLKHHFCRLYYFLVTITIILVTATKKKKKCNTDLVRFVVDDRETFVCLCWSIRQRCLLSREGSEWIGPVNPWPCPAHRAFCLVRNRNKPCCERRFVPPPPIAGQASCLSQRCHTALNFPFFVLFGLAKEPRSCPKLHRLHSVNKHDWVSKAAFYFLPLFLTCGNLSTQGHKEDLQPQRLGYPRLGFTTGEVKLS